MGLLQYFIVLNVFAWSVRSAITPGRGFSFKKTTVCVNHTNSIITMQKFLMRSQCFVACVALDGCLAVTLEKNESEIYFSCSLFLWLSLDPIYSSNTTVVHQKVSNLTTNNRI